MRSQRPAGWLPLPDRFDDEGYSGATTDRPALQRLLALVRARKVDLVVIHRLDRLSRSVLGCATLLEEFRKFGVGLVIVTAQELGHSAHDSFLLNILTSFAEFEREMIAARIAESRARLKARGLRIAGSVPFGYDADPRSKQLVPNAGESAVVKWLFEQAAAGRTPAEIADANTNGWRTKERTARRTANTRSGNPWTARQVVATLRNPVYLGLFRDKHDFRIGHHDPIVTHELFAAAGAQLSARQTRDPGQHYQMAWPLRDGSPARSVAGSCHPTRSAIEVFGIDITGATRPQGARSLADCRSPHRTLKRRSAGNYGHHGVWMSNRARSVTTSRE